jgi:diaminohydroxyphosphoribosylaminopyrimidine deaminase/5-amino-6-(5-phosphoribosylamino)uracil reductase
MHITTYHLLLVFFLYRLLFYVNLHPKTKTLNMNIGIDEVYMQRCLDLAAKACITTIPNPMVGCVIVYNGRIIGEGFHTKQGSPHAEVHAIDSVKNKQLLKEATLYVNLEPCCHFGKTPPCTDLIIKHNIPHIVIGTLDVNPCVQNKGVERLKANCTTVKVGVLENECKELNKRFFTFHTKKRPYIILKWAQSIDGYMDISPAKREENTSYWISNETLKLKVHQWRAQEKAIFVGANTILRDNPQLNVRYCSGENPTRMTLLNKQLYNNNFHFFDTKQSTLIFTTFQTENHDGIHYHVLNKTEDYDKQIMDELYALGYQSILIEGGKKTLERLIGKNLWDEARVLIGNRYFGEGLKAPTISLFPYKTETYDEDKVLYIKNLYS